MAITIGNVAANMRPKALEDVAALSMVAVVARIGPRRLHLCGEERRTSDERCAKVS
jgi:hypothetical protein